MWNVVAELRLIRAYMAVALTLATVFVPLSKSKASAISNQQLISPSVFDQKPDRFYDYYLNEIQFLSVEQIQNLNNKNLQELKDYVPPANDQRAQAITERLSQELMNLVPNHPVVGYRANERYQHAGADDIGYCFGRAMYLHLMALKLGLQKESIKKIWALGPMRTSTQGLTWGYHVALMVYSKDLGWLVLDPNLSSPQKFEDWIKHYYERSQDQKLRFYVTEPKKFGLYSGPYSRYILGLDLSVEQDWFKHYFLDMLESVRHETLQSLGLRKITPEEGRVKSEEKTILFDK